MFENYTLHFDGSCWKNPGGTAAGGYTLHKGGELIASGHKVLGTGPKMSNNVAEYYALNLGLKKLIELECKGFITVYGDSDLVIRQMNREWKIKPGRMYSEYGFEAKHLCTFLRKTGSNFMFTWIPREINQECDDLSKAHLTEEEKKNSK